MPMCSDFSELVLVWQQMHVPAMLACDCLDTSPFFIFLLLLLLLLLIKKVHRLV